MTALVLLVQKALSLPDKVVRQANEPFPAGLDAYITIEHHTDTRTTTSKSGFDSVAEVITLSTGKQARLTINAYGTGSFNTLNKLRDLLSAAPAVKSELRKLGLGILAFSEVRNISAWAPPSYEERAVFDTEILYMHKISVDTKRIEQVDINVNGVVRHVEKNNDNFNF